jgi:hypothetical protein
MEEHDASTFFYPEEARTHIPEHNLQAYYQETHRMTQVLTDFRFSMRGYEEFSLLSLF